MSLWDALFAAIRGAAHPSSGEVVSSVSSDARTQEQAFLHVLRCCEGTDGPDGYRTLFGGKLFDSYATHPRIAKQFTDKNGKIDYSTAAGAYQINWPTWLELQPVPDFSPPSQDSMALRMVTQAGALDDVHAGRLQAAIDKCGGRWASLPSARYPQPRRTYQFCTLAFTAANGRLA